MDTTGFRGFVRNLPIVRAIGHETLPYHVGSVWENRLGSQVLRTVSKHLLWKARKREITDEIREYVEALDHDGIAVIENFLDRNQFDEIVSEFENAQKDAELAPYRGDPNARLFRTQSPLTDRSRMIAKHFQQNERLNAIASAVVHRKITRRPDVFLDAYESRDNNGFDNDIENILHADLHTATVKMFFYLNDVNEANGAFVYAKGSHKLTFGRLKHEYDLSIRQAKLKDGSPIPDSLLASRGNETRNIIRPEHRSEMGVAESQVCVKANTLVIANNMGFHRRGEFECGIPRKAILINFRYLETPFF